MAACRPRLELEAVAGGELDVIPLEMEHDAPRQAVERLVVRVVVPPVGVARAVRPAPGVETLAPHPALHLAGPGGEPRRPLDREPTAHPGQRYRGVMGMRAYAGSLHRPGTVSWRVNQQGVLLRGGPRALLLQLAEPAVAAAVAEHSGFEADPFGPATPGSSGGSWPRSLTLAAPAPLRLRAPLGPPAPPPAARFPGGGAGGAA